MSEKPNLFELFRSQRHTHAFMYENERTFTSLNHDLFTAVDINTLGTGLGVHTSAAQRVPRAVTLNILSLRVWRCEEH